MLARLSILAALTFASLSLACTGGPGDIGDAGKGEGEKAPRGSDTGRPGDVPDASSRDEDGSSNPSPDPPAKSSGLVGFCEHYFECGGSSFSDVDRCVEQSLAAWGECRRPQLDAWGDCMIAKQKCEGWNPDAYNPRNGPCASEFSEVQSAACE